MTSKAKPQWQKLVERKQKHLMSQMPSEWIISNDQHHKNATHVIASSLSSAEQQITELPLSSLIEALRHGHLTSQEVLSAFFHRAVVAHQLVRCLSELNYEVASQRARELDAYWREHKAPIGPLHGLPVSMMDRFHIAGIDSACGFVSWSGIPRSAADEGGMVLHLRKLGAVIFCKTAVPMSMMMGETTSNVIGTTVSPYNIELSSGGACGGEGALLASCGSPLGIGTDVAGSSRIPGSWNGLSTLKCSEERLPSSGTATALTGLPTASGAIGLMSRDPKGLRIVFEALLSVNEASSDPFLLHLPWRQSAYDDIQHRQGQEGLGNGRLCLGLMACDGQVSLHPSVKRAIALVRAAMIRRGHEIVDWHPPPHGPAVENLFKIFGSTCMADARLAIDVSGEPPAPQMKEWYDQQDLEPSSTAEFWSLCAKRSEYRFAYAAHMISMGAKTQSGRAIDGIILPVAPTPAIRSGNFRYYGYSAIANVLDYAAGTFPVTLGSSKLDAVSHAASTPLSPIDGMVRETFDGESVQGMPVGLQVMCPRLQEERVLGLMQAIGEALS